MDDVGFISAVVDWTQARADIPEGMVFAGGDSNGGMVSIARVAFLPSLFAIFCYYNTSLFNPLPHA